MKKMIINLVFTLVLLFTVSSCNKNLSPSDDIDIPTDDKNFAINENANILVAYFSAPDNVNNSYVEVDGEKLGNTQYMACVIQKNTNANIFRILPITPYPTNHSELLKVAQEEKNSNARPKIKDEIDDFDKYDVFFVGYPNWNSDLPNIMYTFFDNYDFSNKIIIPFITHGGSGFSKTRETIKKLEPNATMGEGLSISRNNIKNSEQTIVNWIIKLGYKKD